MKQDVPLSVQRSNLILNGLLDDLPSPRAAAVEEVDRPIVGRHQDVGDLAEAESFSPLLQMSETGFELLDLLAVDARRLAEPQGVAAPDGGASADD